MVQVFTQIYLIVKPYRSKILTYFWSGKKLAQFAIQENLHGSEDPV